MAEKKIKHPSRDEHSLRTLAYYQKQGGIFNDVITILIKLRDDPATSRSLAPNRVLNEATWLFEVNKVVELPEQVIPIFESCWQSIERDYCSKDQDLIRCVLFILLNYPYKHRIPLLEGTMPMTVNSIELCNYLDEKVVNETLFYPKFKYLLNTEYLKYNENTRPEISNHLNKVEDELVEARIEIAKLQEQLKAQSELSLVKDAEIECLRRDLKTTQETLANIPNQSTLDTSISFNRIIYYIKSCKQYKFTTQIFMMLNWLMRHNATDEQYQILDETQQFMMSLKSGDETTIINNDNHGCNVVNEAHDPVFGTPLDK